MAKDVRQLTGPYQSLSTRNLVRSLRTTLPWKCSLSKVSRLWASFSMYFPARNLRIVCEFFWGNIQKVLLAMDYSQNIYFIVSNFIQNTV